MRRILIWPLFVGLLSLGMLSGMFQAAHAQTAPDDPPTVQQAAYQAPLTGLPPGAAVGASARPPLSPAAAARAQPAPLVDLTAQASPFKATAALATAQCKDAWFSYSATREGTCDGHGGVMTWIIEPGSVNALLHSRAQQASLTPPYCQFFIPPSPATWDGPCTGSSGIYVRASGCWTGAYGPISSTTSVQGCGNANYPFALRRGDSLAGSFSLNNSGSLTVTALCGGSSETQTTSDDYGSVTVGCYVP